MDSLKCRASLKPKLSTYGIGDPELDQEGRTIRAEFPGFHLLNVYTPNAGDGLKRLDYRIKQWDLKFADYIAKLSETKPVVCCGDLNCAHEPIDIHSPKTNLKSAGFTQVMTFDSASTTCEPTPSASNMRHSGHWHTATCSPGSTSHDSLA